MTTPAFEQFRTQVSADKALQTAVAACFSSPPTEGSTGFDKLAALGKSHGFDFTAQDVQGSMVTGDATLSDFELELVSAGNGTDAKTAMTQGVSAIGKGFLDLRSQFEQGLRQAQDAVSGNRPGPR